MTEDLNNIFIKSTFKFNKKISIYVVRRFPQEVKEFNGQHYYISSTFLHCRDQQRIIFKKQDSDAGQYVPALSQKEKSQMRECVKSLQIKQNEILYILMPYLFKQDFRIGRPSTFFNKKTYCIDTIQEMCTTLKRENFSTSDLDRDNDDFQALKFSFFFKKPIVFDDSNVFDEFLLDYSNSISFKRCSAQLVLNAYLFGNFKQVRVFKIEECSITDPDVITIAQRMEINHGTVINEDNGLVPTNKDGSNDKRNTFTFNNVEFNIKKCQYITSELFVSLRNWDNNSFVRPEKKFLGCGLALNSLSFLRSTTLLQFSTTQQLRKLKIKNHPSYSNSGQLLSLLLTSRNFTKKTQASINNEQRRLNKDIDSDDDIELEEELDEVHSDALHDDGKLDKVCSNLERLSFDYSVCNNFDELPLNSDYFKKMRSISYNSRHKIQGHGDKSNAHGHGAHGAHGGHGKEEKSGLVKITFSNMYPYSLKKLQSLKLKYCSLENKFFLNIEYMQCVSSLQIINFSHCHIEIHEFCTFIINSKLKKLKTIILKSTNVDDQFCSLISDKTVVSFSLEEVDVSDCKHISLKGVKYLTFIDTLKCLNIKGLDQINCQLSTFLIDLLERKSMYISLQIKNQIILIQLKGTLYIDSSLKDIELRKNIDLCESRKQAILQLTEEQLQFRNRNNSGGSDGNSSFDKYQDDLEVEGFYESSEKSMGDESEGGDEYENEGKDQIIEKNNELQKKNQKNQKIQQPKHPYYDLLQSYTHKSPQIVHIDFTRCHNVTTPLLEDLFRHRLLNRLSYLNLENTKVCNNLIDIFKQSCVQEQDGIVDFYESHVHKNYDPLHENEVLEVCDGQYLHQSIKFFSIKDCKIIRDFKMVFLFKAIPLINLQILDVSNCNIFDQSLFELSTNALENYPNLTKLHLQMIKSSPKGIQSIRKLPANKIVFIDLKSTNFDDETSLVFFSAEKNELLKTLQFLGVKDCKQLTTTGLEAMIDGLFGLSRAEIYAKRFNVSDEEKKLFEKKEQEKKQIALEKQKKLIEEMKKQLKQQKKNKKKNKGNEIHPSSKKKQISQEDIQAQMKVINTSKCKEICENFDVFGLLSSCYQLVTDKLFIEFLQKLSHVVKNIYELNLNKMGRLTLDELEFDQDIEQTIFKNLEILNINETRITSNFVKRFLKFWMKSNTEKNSATSKLDEFKMKNFMVLKCQKAYFVSSSVLDVFRNVKNIRNILSKTHFKMEILLNELGLKIMDDHLLFLSDLRSSETRFVSINIRELNLENNQFISSTGFSTILNSNWMKFILRFNVRNTQFGNSQLEQMSQMMKDKKTQSQFLKLQYIGLRGCIFVSRRGLSILCQMEKLNEDFDLGCICELKMLIDADLMKDMAQSLYCRNMEFLDLSENGFQQIDKGFKYLCFKGRDVKLKLKIINVSSTWISDKALQSIAVSENLNSLEKVIIRDCKKLTERGLSYLVDSRHLLNLDLFYLFGSNTSLLSGRVIDTMKYSDRKKTIREISLVGSLAQDKEMNNIMQEVISQSFKIKALDIRKTSHIGISGLSYVYNMIQWNIVKNQKVSCSLKVLILDNNFSAKYSYFFKQRYQEFKARYKYEHYKKQIKSLPDCTIKDPDYTQNFIESNAYKEAKNKFKGLKDQMTFKQFQDDCSAIFKKLRHKIRTSTKPQKLSEIFTGPGDFIQNLFLSANNLKKFKYDYFIKRFALNIDEEFIDQLTLCDQKFSIYKDTESPGEGNQMQNDLAINKFSALSKNKKDNEIEDDEQQTTYTVTFPTFINQFEYFDIIGNKVLSDDPVCRFFLSSQMVSQLRIINISFTLLSEKVILAICASPFLRENLEVVYFSRCPKLNVKNALQYLLMTDFKNFKYKSVLSEYHRDINDEILALMLVKFSDSELKYLNLQNSKITSQGLLLLEESDSNQALYMLDLQNTGIEACVLDKFMIDEPGQGGQHSSPFPENLRYMWLEGTYNLTDEEMFKMKFWDKFNSKNFDFMEMIQSKSRKLNQTLIHLTNIKLRKQIFRKSYIQLDIFPYITPDVLIKFINDQFINECNDFYDLKYITVGFRKQHYPALKECFKWYSDQNVEKYLNKYCYRITKIPSDYQDIPLLKLTSRSLESKSAEVRESIQFDYHNYLTSMTYEDILKINKFVEHSHLIKLDFENTDITGNLFMELCKSIKGDSNRITEVSLKGIHTIRDEQIVVIYL